MSEPSSSNDGPKCEEQSRLKADVYFLIQRFLSDGALKKTLQTFSEELEEQKILPKRIDWQGSEHDRSVDDMERQYPYIHRDFLYFLCQQASISLNSNNHKTSSFLSFRPRARNRDGILHNYNQIFNCVAKIHGSPIQKLKESINMVNHIRSRELTGPLSRSRTIRPRFYKDMHKQRLTIGHLSAVYCLLFDHTGDFIITGADDLLIKMWSTHTARLIMVFRGASSEIADIAIDPENTLLAAGSLDRILRVWNMQTGVPVAVLTGQPGMITSVNFCPTPCWGVKYLISTGTDGSVAFWTYNHDGFGKADFRNTPTLYQEKMRPGVAQMICSSFSPGGTFLATGSADHHVRVYYMKGDEGPQRILETEAHSDRVDSMQWAHSGLKFLSGSKDGVAIIWWFERQQWKSIHLVMATKLPSDNTQDENKKLRVTMVAWDFSDSIVITAVSDHTLKVWKASDGQLLKILTGHKDEVYVLESHPLDEDVLLSAGHDGQLFVWDINKGEIVAKYLNEIEGQGHSAIYDAKWSPEGSKIAASDSHGDIITFGFGSGSTFYEHLPKELFFHTDYRPLVRDQNYWVLDEQTQVPPHLMPPPFLVDMDGNPYPPMLQRLVPGRECCNLEQLVPNIVIGNGGSQEVIQEIPRRLLEESDDEQNRITNQQQRSQRIRQSTGNWQSDPNMEWKRNILIPPLNPAVLERSNENREFHNKLELQEYQKQLRKRPLMINTSMPSSSKMREKKKAGAKRTSTKPKPLRTHVLSPREDLHNVELAPISPFASEDSSGYSDWMEENERKERRSNRKNHRRNHQSRRKSGRRKRPTSGTSDDLETETDTEVDDSDMSNSSLDTTQSEEENNVNHDSDDSPERNSNEDERREKRNEKRKTPIKPPKENNRTVKVSKPSKPNSKTNSPKPATSKVPNGGPSSTKVNSIPKSPAPKVNNVSCEPGPSTSGISINGGLNKQNKGPKIKKSENYKLSEWLSETKPKKSPYFPQLWDEIVYFVQGHQLYVEAVRIKNVYQEAVPELPWVRMPDLRDHEFCQVIDIQYQIKPPRLCVLKLAIQEEDGTSTGKVFSVRYHDMPDVLDFFVLKQTYTTAMSRNWKLGDKFRCMIDDNWWMGHITNKSPACDVFPESSFMCYEITWTNGEKERMSPWDMEPIDEQRLPEDEKAAIPVLTNEITAVLYKCTPEDWPDCERDTACKAISRGITQVMELAIAEPFLVPVDINEYPTYARVIEYPIDLSTIKGRFENNFYRRLEAAKYDIGYLKTNAEKFNEKHSIIIKHARILTSLCLEIAQSGNNHIDIASVYHQLVDGYDSPCSDTSEAEDTDVVVPKKEPESLPSTSRSLRSFPARSWKVQGDWKQSAKQLLDLIYENEDSVPFQVPVDFHKYPMYHALIDIPMDLGTVRNKLLKNQYSLPQDFALDMRLIFENSKKFNTNKRSLIYIMTVRLATIFEDNMKKIINSWRQQRKRQRRRHTFSEGESDVSVSTADKSETGDPPFVAEDKRSIDETDSDDTPLDVLRAKSLSQTNTEESDSNSRLTERLPERPPVVVKQPPVVVKHPTKRKILQSESDDKSRTSEEEYKPPPSTSKVVPQVTSEEEEEKSSKSESDADSTRPRKSGLRQRPKRNRAYTQSDSEDDDESLAKIRQKKRVKVRNDSSSSVENSNEVNGRRSASRTTLASIQRKKNHAKVQNDSSSALGISNELNRRRSTSRATLASIQRKKNHAKVQNDSSSALGISNELNRRRSTSRATLASIQRKKNHAKVQNDSSSALGISNELNRRRSTSRATLASIQRKKNHAKVQNDSSSALGISNELNRRRSTSRATLASIQRKTNHANVRNDSSSAVGISNEVNGRRSMSRTTLASRPARSDNDSETDSSLSTDDTETDISTDLTNRDTSCSTPSTSSSNDDRKRRKSRNNKRSKKRSKGSSGKRRMSASKGRKTNLRTIKKTHKSNASSSFSKSNLESIIFESSFEGNNRVMEPNDSLFNSTPNDDTKFQSPTLNDDIYSDNSCNVSFKKSDYSEFENQFSGVSDSSFNDLVSLNNSSLETDKHPTYSHLVLERYPNIINQISNKFSQKTPNAIDNNNIKNLINPKSNFIKSELINPLVSSKERVITCYMLPSVVQNNTQVINSVENESNSETPVSHIVSGPASEISNNPLPNFEGGHCVLPLSAQLELSLKQNVEPLGESAESIRIELAKPQSSVNDIQGNDSLNAHSIISSEIVSTESLDSNLSSPLVDCDVSNQVKTDPEISDEMETNESQSKALKTHRERSSTSPEPVASKKPRLQSDLNYETLSSKAHTSDECVSDKSIESLNSEALVSDLENEYSSITRLDESMVETQDSRPNKVVFDKIQKLDKDDSLSDLEADFDSIISETTADESADENLDDLMKLSKDVTNKILQNLNKDASIPGLENDDNSIIPVTTADNSVDEDQEDQSNKDLTDTETTDDESADENLDDLMQLSKHITDKIIPNLVKDASIPDLENEDNSIIPATTADNSLNENQEDRSNKDLTDTETADDESADENDLMKLSKHITDKIIPNLDKDASIPDLENEYNSIITVTTADKSLKENQCDQSDNTSENVTQDNRSNKNVTDRIIENLSEYMEDKYELINKATLGDQSVGEIQDYCLNENMTDTIIQEHVNCDDNPIKTNKSNEYADKTQHDRSNKVDNPLSAFEDENKFNNKVNNNQDVEPADETHDDRLHIDVIDRIQNTNNDVSQSDSETDSLNKTNPADLKNKYNSIVNATTVDQSANESQGDRSEKDMIDTKIQNLNDDILLDFENAAQKSVDESEDDRSNKNITDERVEKSNKYLEEEHDLIYKTTADNESLDQMPDDCLNKDLTENADKEPVGETKDDQLKKKEEYDSINKTTTYDESVDIFKDGGLNKNVTDKIIQHLEHDDLLSGFESDENSIFYKADKAEKSAGETQNDRSSKVDKPLSDFDNKNNVSSVNETYDDWVNKHVCNEMQNINENALQSDLETGSFNKANVPNESVNETQDDRSNKDVSNKIIENLIDGAPLSDFEDDYDACSNRSGFYSDVPDFPEFPSDGEEPFTGPETRFEEPDLSLKGDSEEDNIEGDLSDSLDPLSAMDKEVFDGDDSIYNDEDIENEEDEAEEADSINQDEVDVIELNDTNLTNFSSEVVAIETVSEFIDEANSEEQISEAADPFSNDIVDPFNDVSDNVEENISGDFGDPVSGEELNVSKTLLNAVPIQAVDLDIIKVESEPNFDSESDFVSDKEDDDVEENVDDDFGDSVDEEESDESSTILDVAPVQTNVVKLSNEQDLDGAKNCLSNKDDEHGSEDNDSAIDRGNNENNIPDNIQTQSIENQETNQNFAAEVTAFNNIKENNTIGDNNENFEEGAKEKERNEYKETNTNVVDAAVELGDNNENFKEKSKEKEKDKDKETSKNVVDAAAEVAATDMQENNTVGDNIEDIEEGPEEEEEDEEDEFEDEDETADPESIEAESILGVEKIDEKLKQSADSLQKVPSVQRPKRPPPKRRLKKESDSDYEPSSSEWEVSSDSDSDVSSKVSGDLSSSDATPKSAKGSSASSSSSYETDTGDDNKEGILAGVHKLKKYRKKQKIKVPLVVVIKSEKEVKESSKDQNLVNKEKSVNIEEEWHNEEDNDDSTKEKNQETFGEGTWWNMDDNEGDEEVKDKNQDKSNAKDTQEKNMEKENGTIGLEQNNLKEGKQNQEKNIVQNVEKEISTGESEQNKLNEKEPDKEKNQEKDVIKNLENEVFTGELSQYSLKEKKPDRKENQEKDIEINQVHKKKNVVPERIVAEKSSVNIAQERIDEENINVGGENMGIVWKETFGELGAVVGLVSRNEKETEEPKQENEIKEDDDESWLNIDKTYTSL